MTPIDLHLIRDTLLAALREDLGSGDITSRATIPEKAHTTGRYTTKQPLIVSGLSVVEEVIRLVDPTAEYRGIAHDGDAVEKGIALAEVRGSARSILAAERLTLNLLQRMCGIATLTRDYVDRLKGTSARIVDTRKTAPG